MEITDYTLESEGLQKSLDVEVYGTEGRPVIAFPEGDSSCTSWDNGGMVDALSDLIEDHRIQLFCVDSDDEGGWYSRFATADYRLTNISAFFDFVDNVLSPFVREHNSSWELPIVAGAGMGALNATLAILRRPDLFGGLLALSGTYDARDFAADGFDERWADFSPVDIVDQVPDGGLENHPIAFVCGQAPSETCIGSQRIMEGLLADKGIDATFEYWGLDVSHDWSWWQEEARQLLPCLLESNGLLKRKLSACFAIAKAAAEHAAERLRVDKEELSAANAEVRAARSKAKSTTARIAVEEAAVEASTAAETKLSKASKAAWAKRDAIAAQLAEADEKARAAQDAADAAARDRASAEWIAGEARADAAQAVAEKDAANKRVAAAKAAVKESTAAAEKTAAELEATNAKMQP